jgi:uncharacterized membrane protein
MYLFVSSCNYSVNYKLAKKTNFSKINSLSRSLGKNFSFYLSGGTSSPKIGYFKNGKFLKKNRERNLSYTFICTFLSITGFIETFYLTISKISGSSVVCSDQNCSMVLSSVFSNFLDIPVSLFGIILYFLTGLQIFEFLGYTREYNLKKSFFEGSSILFPLFLSFFSSYFVYILEEILKTTCPWCFFSIFISGAILILWTITSIGEQNIGVKSLIFFFFLTSFSTFFMNSLNIIELQNF